VPTFYTRLLDEPGFDKKLVGHMRLFTSGSAPLLAETFEEFKSRTGMAILERYGMTETGMNTSNPYHGERRAGTVGFPLTGVEVRVMIGDTECARGEIGDLQVRGQNVFSGYWRMPEKTAEEFAEGQWFKTGDIAMIDTDGYVHLVGRAKDLIISGGYNVYPKEIEELVDDMDEVLESAIVGVTHRDFGEAGVAVIVLNKGATLDEATLIARLKEKIANYKVPKRAFIVESLPRNTMGKVQKNLLRETYKDACR
jgi:malonyl-CoA/methylmalonyl-CoA synthetase